MLNSDICLLIPTIIFFCNDVHNTTLANNRLQFKSGLLGIISEFSKTLSTNLGQNVLLGIRLSDFENYEQFQYSTDYVRLINRYYIDSYLAFNHFQSVLLNASVEVFSVILNSLGLYIWICGMIIFLIVFTFLGMYIKKQNEQYIYLKKILIMIPKESLDDPNSLYILK